MDSPGPSYLRRFSAWSSPLPYLSEQRKRVNDVVRSARTYQWTLRTAVVIACLVVCASQCWTILSLYLDYPTTVYVYMERMEKLETPGLTICNNNRMVLSKLMHHNHSFRANWQRLSDSATGDDFSDTEINLAKQALIDDALRFLVESAPVYTVMRLGHTYDDFLVMDDFKCASDEQHVDRPCRSFANVITTTQSVGNCFTLFHRSYTTLSDDVDVKAGLSQSPVLKGSNGSAVDIEMSEKPFRPNEVVRLKVNFSALEYTTINEPVAGSLAIHDANSAPGVRTRSFTIYPGQFYDFFITKQTSVLLPAPYVTDCISYTKMNSRYYEDSGDQEENINSIYKYPLSKADCVIGCMAYATVAKCGCWPPEVPFLANAVPRGKENSLRWCDWDTDSGALNMTDEGNGTVSLFSHCFTVHENDCQVKCKDECRTDRYTVQGSSRQWPATERIEHSQRRDLLKSMRNCCAIISIRYWSTEHTIHKYQAKFEPIELMSYLSGLVSMWLGVSALGGFITFEKSVERLVAIIRKRWLERDTLDIPVRRSRAGQRWNNTRIMMNALRELDSRAGQRRALPTYHLDKDTRFRASNVLVRTLPPGASYEATLPFYVGR